MWGALSAQTKGREGTVVRVDKTAVPDKVTPPSPAAEMKTQPTQDTVDSTVSSLQSSLQQEVERANRLRKVAAEESKKSLLAMQIKVNTRLEAMDATIKGVHEGQSLNDKNINSMMTKMDIFGRQMQRLEERLTERTTGHHYSADGGQQS